MPPTQPRVRLGQRMRTTLHAAVVSYRQLGLIVTSKMDSAGRIVTVTIRSHENTLDEKSGV
jgi:hypothetical protein